MRVILIVRGKEPELGRVILCKKGRECKFCIDKLNLLNYNEAIKSKRYNNLPQTIYENTHNIISKIKGWAHEGVAVH